MYYIHTVILPSISHLSVNVDDKRLYNTCTSCCSNVYMDMCVVMVIGGLFCSERLFQLPLTLSYQFVVHEEELPTR